MENYSEVIRYFRKFPDHKKVNFSSKIDIEDYICEIFKIPSGWLFRKSRKKEIINARRLYMYILNRKMKWGPSATERFTGWDHSSVIYSSRKCEDFMENEKDYREKAEGIFAELKYGRIKIPDYPTLPK
jgi:chromosomal replication initiation ATPase DnaA